MVEAVRKRQRENKRKMQEAAKAKQNPDKPTGARFRKSPLGQRLAALRKKKMDEG